jgi:hypothetical protein
MKTYNPSVLSNRVDNETRIWMQSMHKTLNSGIDMGSPTSAHKADGSINAGVYTQFDRGNSSGILIRIGATGSTGSGTTLTWPSSGGLKIAHGLNRQPIGFKIVDKDKTVDVYRTAPPDTNSITLAPTDPSASVTLYIF